MEFTFTTDYDKNALTAMAHVLRKTARRKRSRRSHIFGWIIIVLSLLITVPLDGSPLVIDGRKVLTWAVVLVLLLTLIFEDRLNGYIARKRMLAGSERTECVFREENYTSSAGIATTEWSYGNIKSVAETKNYFVFMFDTNHAQVYDKRTIAGGAVDEFRQFIAGKIGSEVVFVK